VTNPRLPRADVHGSGPIAIPPMVPRCVVPAHDPPHVPSHVPAHLRAALGRSDFHATTANALDGCRKLPSGVPAALYCRPLNAATLLLLNRLNTSRLRDTTWFRVNW